MLVPFHAPVHILCTLNIFWSFSFYFYLRFFIFFFIFILPFNFYSFYYLYVSVSLFSFHFYHSVNVRLKMYMYSFLLCACISSSKIYATGNEQREKKKNCQQLLRDSSPVPLLFILHTKIIKWDEFVITLPLRP